MAAQEISLTEFSGTTTPCTSPLPWYDIWLDKQLKALPISVLNSLGPASQVFEAVTGFCTPETSLDDIMQHLVDLELIQVDGTDIERQHIGRSIASALLGWQTMLYLPAFGTCPPQQMAIADLLDGYVGQAYMTMKQDQSRAMSSLADFLLGFGLMLPSENLCISDDPEDCAAFEKVDIVAPEELNACLLKSFAHINIQWVDTLAPHMELDKATNTLFLFRFPSFCLASLPKEGKSAEESLLHRCANHSDSPSQWASPLEVTQLLREILLSYRLLFGQNAKSRRLFQSMMAAESNQEPKTRDSILAQLCCGKTCDLPVQDRDFYRLRRDFPILRGRIATLSYQMKNLKPRSWRDLWNDKRDSAQWLTFWAVIFIGASGVLLSLIQVLLQAAQLAGSK